MAEVDGDIVRGADFEADTTGDDDEEANNATGEVLFVREIDGDGVVGRMASHNALTISLMECARAEKLSTCM